MDTWDTKHDDQGNFHETFAGKKPMENVPELTYLGATLAAGGKNKNRRNSLLKKIRT